MKTRSENYSQNKKQATIFADETLRGVNANIKAWKQAYNESDAAKALFKEDGLTREMIDFNFIMKNLPGRLNSAGVFCQLRKYKDVTNEDGTTSTAEELAKAFAAGLESVELKEFNDGATWVAFIPKSRFTALEFYNLIKAANTAKQRAEVAKMKEVEKAAKEAAKAEKEAQKAAAKAAKEEQRTFAASLESATPEQLAKIQEILKAGNAA